MNVDIDLSEFPEEVTNYVISELHDCRANHHIEKAIESTFTGNEPFETDLDNQKVTLTDTVVNQMVKEITEEILSNLLEEVRNGERHDYTESEIRFYIAKLEDKF